MGESSETAPRNTILDCSSLEYASIFLVVFLMLAWMRSPCRVGAWQWPSRGRRIGEADHPGPLRRMTAAYEEWLFSDVVDGEKESFEEDPLDDALHASIGMATRTV